MCADSKRPADDDPWGDLYRAWGKLGEEFKPPVVKAAEALIDFIYSYMGPWWPMGVILPAVMLVLMLITIILLEI